MAFPTTSQLTDFSGGAETPISESGAWVSTGGALSGGSDANRDGSGHMTLASQFEMKRSGTVGPDFETWATLSTAPGGAFKALWYLSGSDNYRLEITSGDVWRFYKTGDVLIGSDLATQAMANGDAFGFEYVAGTGTLRAYRKPSGGSWGQVGTDRADSLLASGTGNLAVAAEGGNVFDDFGGGTVASGPPTLAITPRGTVFKE